MAKSIKVWVARDKRITPGIRSTGVFSLQPVLINERYGIIDQFYGPKGMRIVGFDLKPGECRSARIILED